MNENVHTFKNKLCTNYFYNTNKNITIMNNDYCCVIISLNLIV